MVSWDNVMLAFDAIGSLSMFCRQHALRIGGGRGVWLVYLHTLCLFSHMKACISHAFVFCSSAFSVQERKGYGVICTRRYLTWSRKSGCVR